MSEVFDQTVYRLVGDRGLLAEFGAVISPEINRKVRMMALALERDPLTGVAEVIPTYRSLLISYDPDLTGPGRLRHGLGARERDLEGIEIPPPKTVDIPVLYGGDMGPDLDFVADHCGLSRERVIELHTTPAYPIYMIGFTPGFPFLGGLDERLATPRLQTPRTVVPVGSVGIANNQTGVYPVTSPGGWQLIGRTPLKLFDPGRENPFLYRAGDLIRFRPIDENEYHSLGGEGV